MNVGSRLRIRVLFEPRDLWIGVYWKSYREMGNRMADVYVCVVPMFPILFTIKVKKWRYE